MHLRKYRNYCSIVAMSLFATVASAQSTCDSYLSLYDSDPILYSYVPQVHPECFGASQQTSTVSINQTSFVQISTISSALSTRFLASPPPSLVGISSGRAAAAPGKRWNVWGNLTSNTTEQSFMRPAPANSRIDISNDALTTVLGGDITLSPTMAVGVSAAFDRASGDSRVAGAVQNNLLNEGYMVAPYVGLSLGKTLAVDASVGMGQGTLSQSGGVSADADRWFAGANLNYSNWMGNTQITGKLSWMHGEEKYDKAKTPTIAAVTGTDAKNKIDQWRLGAQAAWWMNGTMPYVGLSYLTERRSTTLIGATDPIGKDAWLFSIGANFLSLASGITGGVAYEQEFDRTNQDNYRLMANIGLRF